MSIQNNPPSDPLPRAKSPWKSGTVVAFVTMIIVAAIIIVVAINWILPPRWRPQLDVTNTGTNTVTLSYKGHATVTAPGQIWHTRFSAGDTIVIRSSQGDGAAEQTIQLPASNPKPWTLHPIAQRWTAEVNADDPKNIRFEKRGYEEISAPPSAPQPWP